MSESAIELDAERQGRARDYARIRRRLMLLDLAMGLVYLLAWLSFGWHRFVGGWIAGFITQPWLALIAFAAAFGAPYMLLDLPLSYYSGFVLPHRFGQSTQTLGGWIVDQVKGFALTGLFGLIVLEIIYALLRAFPGWWWLLAGGVMLIFNLLLSSLAPVLIAPLFYKFSPLEDEELTARLMRLAEQAGTRVQGVFRFDMSSRTKSANAALMGLGATRRIVLGDTLLDEFTHDEIEVVLAHELGHHVHHDIPLLIAVGALQTLLGFWLAHLALLAGVRWLGLQSIADPAGLPLFALATGLLGLLLMAPGNAFSRWRERLADRYALESTRKPQAFADGMTRLANQNLAEAEPEAWVVWLLHSHPPISERVAAAHRFARRME